MKWRLMDSTSTTDEDWIDSQDAKMTEGKKLIQQASNEALEYLTDAVENINDKQWRKMVIESQALEMGIGVGLVEHLVPSIYRDMEKSLHKKVKVSKTTARALRQIYIGRVIKNIIKEAERGSTR